MKGSMVYIAILALALLIIPMVALSYDVQAPAQEEPAQVHTPNLPAAGPEEQEESARTEDAAVDELGSAGDAVAEIGDDLARDELDENTREELPASDSGVESFQILDESTGFIQEVSLRDYVRGAVAAEMPASFHEEALKAQAVAAHTYALHNHLAQQEDPDPALEGADFSADPSNRKGYVTEETAREIFGGNEDLYWNKICKAADSVLGYVLEYEDEPIVAAYHAISAGHTEDAANVWVGEAPYLQAVESEGDSLAPDYEVVTKLTAEEVRQVLEAYCPDANLSGDPGTWFDDIQRSNSGYITSVSVGGVSLHGRDIRTMFDLRSHNLDIEYADSGFRITSYGYGHGVGLSQYGADFMARQGSTFDEILEHYYEGTVLKEIALED